jgi:hypothetical protein
MQLAGVDGAREGGFESRQIEHRDRLWKGRVQSAVRAQNGEIECYAPFRTYRTLAHSATMRMEMSAALAEWVSAPTLMKSTPVSA